VLTSSCIFLLRDMSAVVDIRWGLEEERGDIADFGVDGVLTFKRDEPSEDEVIDFPTTLRSSGTSRT
jgi:hypothetical protein